MEKKKLILIISIIICLLACIFLLLVNVFGLNLIRHEDIQIDNISLKYYGNLNSVKVVKIYDGAIRRGTFEIGVDKSILEKSNEYSPYLDDINQDGHKDILLPHSFDQSNSIRYSVYIWNNVSKMFEETEELTDVANLTFDDEGNLLSFVNIHKTIFPADKNVPEIYESRRISKKFKLIDGAFHLVSDYTLIYYSETDAYCYSMTDYDPVSGEIVSLTEDWMTEKEAAQIKFFK